MTFQSQPSEQLKKTLKVLKRKDPTLFAAVKKKMWQIVSLDIKGIEHFKNLKGGKSHLKRVHISSFVLTFKVKGTTIFFEDFSHHDRIYSK
ncbi:MAG: addiction module toxin RelE [Nanoarchaeota archaeon]|nr:addiction module toxin RelE [Nanoarchaeota archaeon]